MQSVVSVKANSNQELSIPIRILSREEYNPLKDNNIEKVLTEAAKENIHVDVIDMEKMVFSPYLFSGEELCKITFDLYFRQRDLEGWNTDDIREWNEDFTNKSPIDITTGGDVYSAAGFTAEDVRFQKSKLKQSFIRILFYDSKNPLTQKLLCYSTVFIDSNKMFKAFIKGERVGISLSVRDRIYRYASSEGFYAYFFPDAQQLEKAGETIYMKIEFNHAGYGKTIPMMVPPVKEKVPAGFFVDDQLDVEKYWNNLYIPIVLSRQNGVNQYIFPQDRVILSGGQEIRLVLVEPRINNQ